MLQAHKFMSPRIKLTLDKICRVRRCQLGCFPLPTIFLYLGFLNQHDRDIVANRIYTVALYALKSCTIRDETDLFFA
jgi:hypothetical protein